MKTKKIVIQLIIPEERHCRRDCEFCEYHIYDEEVKCERCERQNVDDLDINLIWKIERYITNGIIVTKTFARNINSNEDYKPMSNILRTEEEYQNIIKSLRQEGYEVISL